LLLLRHSKVAATNEGGQTVPTTAVRRVIVTLVLHSSQVATMVFGRRVKKGRPTRTQNWDFLLLWLHHGFEHI
jgi:hypothetical protein